MVFKQNSIKSFHLAKLFLPRNLTITNCIEDDFPSVLELVAIIS